MTQEQIALSMAYKNTFAGEHGAKVLADLEKRCLWNKQKLYESLPERDVWYKLGAHFVIWCIHNEIERNLSEPEEGKAIHKETLNA